MMHDIQFHQANKANIKDVIILDTGSTISATIMNPEFLINIHKAKSSLKMTTNAGTKELTLKGNVPGFGEAWYDPDMMANIFSFGFLANKHKIKYDTEADAFIVMMNNGNVAKFT